MSHVISHALIWLRFVPLGYRVRKSVLSLACMLCKFKSHVVERDQYILLELLRPSIAGAPWGYVLFHTNKDNWAFVVPLPGLHCHFAFAWLSSGTFLRPDERFFNACSKRSGLYPSSSGTSIMNKQILTLIFTLRLCLMHRHHAHLIHDSLIVVPSLCFASVSVVGSVCMLYWALSIHNGYSPWLFTQWFILEQEHMAHVSQMCLLPSLFGLHLIQAWPSTNTQVK